MTEKTAFTKEHTNMAKGFFILAMLFHHLFSESQVFSDYSISFLFLDNHQGMVLAQFMQFCIAGFAFLTYYGMTVKSYLLKKELTWKNRVLQVKSRVVTLVSSFFFVYVLSIISAFAFGRNLYAVYSREGQFHFGYVILDALGLAHLFATPTLNVTWWYMSFAIVTVILFPIVLYIYDRFVTLLIVVSLLLPDLLHLQNSYLGILWLSLILGIWCAKQNIFVKIYAYKDSAFSYFLKIAACLLLLALAYILRFSGISTSWYMACAAFGMTLCSYLICSKLSLLGNIFSFLGKYSMGIFLTHTFIYYYYGRDFIYSFGNAELIFIVLTAFSVLISVMIFIPGVIIKKIKIGDCYGKKIN